MLEFCEKAIWLVKRALESVQRGLEVVKVKCVEWLVNRVSVMLLSVSKLALRVL